jgi:hypothetical protein
MAAGANGADDEASSAATAWAWTRPQRRVLVLLLLILCPALLVRYACNTAYIPDPPPPHGPRYDEVADKIDPNTADVATLAALPMLGDKRAQDIVEYRERKRAAEPERIVFRRPEDLAAIKGFGRASIDTLRPYLHFPSADRPDRPATQP